MSLFLKNSKLFIFFHFFEPSFDEWLHSFFRAPRCLFNSSFVSIDLKINFLVLINNSVGFLNTQTQGTFSSSTARSSLCPDWSPSYFLYVQIRKHLSLKTLRFNCSCFGILWPKVSVFPSRNSSPFVVLFFWPKNIMQTISILVHSACFYHLQKQSSTSEAQLKNQTTFRIEINPLIQLWSSEWNKVSPIKVKRNRIYKKMLNGVVSWYKWTVPTLLEKCFHSKSRCQPLRWLLKIKRKSHRIPFRSVNPTQIE